MGEVSKAREHKVTLDNRTMLSLTGVAKVLSIDADLVVVVTDMGKLKICGKNMQANTLDLDKGILSLIGNVNSMTYLGDKEGALSLKGLFK